MDIIVYVIYDPLEEKVLCVHNESDMECDTCRPLFKIRTGEKYPLHEIRKKLQIKQHNDNSLH
jgi:hypothetical protein